MTSSKNSVDASVFTQKLDAKYLQAGALLRGTRHREGLPQKDFAKKIGITQGDLSKMENGKRSIGKVVAKRIQKMFEAIASWIEEPAAIVIADTWRHSSAAEQQEGVEHPDEGLVEIGRDHNSVRCCQDPAVQEKVERIHVVIGGLLEIETVVPHLLAGLGEDHLPTHTFPAGSRSQSWKQTPQEEQCDSLA